MKRNGLASCFLLGLARLQIMFTRAETGIWLPMYKLKISCLKIFCSALSKEGKAVHRISTKSLMFAVYEVDQCFLKESRSSKIERPSLRFNLHGSESTLLCQTSKRRPICTGQWTMLHYNLNKKLLIEDFLQCILEGKLNLCTEIL